jgi:hypothetical protein
LSNNGVNWRADVPPGTAGGGGGGWGSGKAAFNYLGNDTAEYKKYYTLKSTDVDTSWRYLVNACNALNNTPAADMTKVLPQFFDIDRTLWFLATEIAFADDDSYIFKGQMDYYLYYEPETGRITPQEYDGNSAFYTAGATWSAFYNETKPAYALLNKLLAVPQYRQRYIAHMRTIMKDEMDVAVINKHIDNFKSHIDTLVNADPKKLYTYAQFNTGVAGLKSFVTTRRNTILNNPEFATVPPVIQYTNMYNKKVQLWGKPAENEQSLIITEVSSTSGINAVNLYYATGIVGNFSSTLMFDDGVHDDGAANDGIFGAKIPGYAAGTWVRFYVEAIANNTAKTVSYMPEGAEHNVFTYIVLPKSAASPVVINEVMASNVTTATDEKGEFEDWIELFNNSASAADISGYYLTDNPTNLNKWKIPANTIIPANGYVIIWADEDSSQGQYHANFKLSGSGEQLYLLDKSQYLLDSVSWGLQVIDKGYARRPNGTGNFVIQTPTFKANNNTSAAKNLEDIITNMNVYPNPAQSYVYIELDQLKKNEPLQILDITGRVIYNEIPSEKQIVDISEYINGIYIIKYNSVIKKLIVNK